MDSWRDSVGGDDNLDAPLWIASYTSGQPAGIPTPWAGLGWAIWQYGDNGKVPGIDGGVDIDVFLNTPPYPNILNLCF